MTRPAVLVTGVGRPEASAPALGPLSALVLSHTESVDSGVLDTTLESFDRHFAVNVRASRQLIAEFAQQVPQTGTPADTADLIAFLLSDHGGWINGQLLKSDGGFSA